VPSLDAPDVDDEGKDVRLEFKVTVDNNGVCGGGGGVCGGGGDDAAADDDDEEEDDVDNRRF